MKKFNVGIIGYSWAADAHIKAINSTSLAQVTAIYSKRKLDPEEISKLYGTPIEIYNDLDLMLSNPEIQVVSICSYPYEHTTQSILSARAGKHLIIEKPIGLQWENCLAVESAVNLSRVKVCVCFECRFSSQFLTTKAILDKGLLGEIHYAEVDYYHGIGPWYRQFDWNIKKNAGGSSLLSAGCHAMDALLLMMGDQVEGVSSYASYSENKDFKNYEYPTSSVSILKFKNGAIGKVASVIDCLQPYYFHVHLVGSEGSLLDNKIYSTQLGGLNKNKWSELSMKLLDSGDVSDHPYQTQFEAFFQSLEKGEEMPLTNLKEALYSHQIIFAADRSIESGKEEKPGLLKSSAQVNQLN
jgi:predicted dehydrogenase